MVDLTSKSDYFNGLTLKVLSNFTGSTLKKGLHSSATNSPPIQTLRTLKFS